MPYLNFENREKRRELMEQFRKEAAANNKAGYEGFVQNIEALNKLMDEYSELDSFGLPKTMTAEMKKTLCDSIIKTAMSGENYLKNARQAAKNDPQIDISKGVPGMIGKLQGMLAQDYEAINAYDPEKNAKSMPEVLEDARSVVVDFRKGSLKRLGASLSSRLAINVVNSKKENLCGVFTKASKIDFLGRFNQAIENTVNRVRNFEEKELLREILPKYKDYMIKKDPSLAGKEDGYFANMFVREACGETVENSAGNEVSSECLDDLLDRIGIGHDKLNYSYNELCSQLSPLNDGVAQVNLKLAGIKDGSRLDVNNTGMSVVAGVLGKSKLLVRAMPMKLRDENGEVMDGTFMDYSKGLALNEQDMSDYKALSSTPFNGSGGAFLRQLADVQVIDYICGNVDRHFGNLMYQTNAKGKIIGVQAIDNDLSFGLFKGATDRRKEMPGLGNMNCITKSTADKIKAMDPDMLRFSLRGRGLSDEQIEFAAERLVDIKQAIQQGEKHYEGRNDVFNDPNPFDKGYLRVIPDEHFSKLSIDKMYIKSKDGKEDQYNLFNEVETWTKARLRTARKYGYKHDPNYKKEALRTGEGRTSDQKYSSKDFDKPLKNAFKLVKTADFNIDNLTVNGNGSKQFDEMVEAIKYVHQLEREYKKLGESEKSLTAVDYSRYVMRM